ncbi:hypothetical protein ZIOFF_045617 [Zingiber officinale]|uniref:DNA-binding protein S1FA n=1 Tax=Zingiber officinale TaxID=94328 RepID=A0A8J5G7C6_ZINOF|nr:hypothetical protein ZIOFF_045617 [Zingiber officinale]
MCVTGVLLPLFIVVLLPISSNPASPSSLFVPDPGKPRFGSVTGRKEKDLIGGRKFCPFAMDEVFSDAAGNIITEKASNGLNPGLVVLLVIGGLVLLFLVGNFALYTYAQNTLPPKKKKPVSKKKIKRERLKQGVSAPGE